MCEAGVLFPTMPPFIDYEAVYLPKNHFIGEESMSPQDYLALFFPFEQLNIQKKGEKFQWNLAVAGTGHCWCRP